MFKTLIGSVLCLLLLLSSTQTTLCQSSKIDGPRKQLSSFLTATQVEQDIDYFQNALKVGHPDLYRYISAEQLDSMLSQVRAKAGTLTLSQLYNELTLVGVAVGCGHLWLGFPKEIERYFYLYSYYPPLYLEVHGNDALVVGEYEHLIGPGLTLVRAIDGVPIDTLIEKLYRYAFRDGYITTGGTHALQNGHFTDMFNRYIADKETYTYLLEQATDSGWVMKEVTLPAWDYKNPTYLYNNQVWREKQLDLSFDEATQSMIMKIKSFDHYSIKKGKQHFFKFLKMAYQEIREKQPKQLIIDVRDNLGGNIGYAEMVLRLFDVGPLSIDSVNVLRYNAKIDPDKLLKIGDKRSYNRILKDSEPVKNGNRLKNVESVAYKWFDEPFGGDLYVMVNGGTFSAASEMACYLKANARATVVGDESGGTCDPITTGYDGVAELPNSKLLLWVPLVTYYNRIPTPAVPGRGLMPDIPFRDLGNNPNADEALDYLLSEIKQQQDKLSVK